MTVQALRKNQNEFTPDAELQTLISDTVAAHVDVTNRFFAEVAPRLEELAHIIAESLNKGGKVLLCGNGGSAADAQHIAAEFVGRLVNDRRSLASIALTTDTSILTAVGNDYGYDDVFSRQVEGLARPEDVLIGITTSGNSANVNKAFAVAKEMGVYSVCLTGKTGGKAKELADSTFIVPTNTTAHIQECHITFMHLVCGLVERKLGIGQ